LNAISSTQTRFGGSFYVGIAVVAALIAAAHALGGVPNGRSLVFALGLGAALGVVLQRSRFCFYCHARDQLEGGNARGLLAILLALAVGTIGMHLVLGSWLPVPAPDRLPPDAHIGPVSWALVLAGLVFGLGMVVSGSCLSAHWYRLGEGSPTSPFALVGSVFGFILGFLSWNGLFTATIATAPPLWLPHWLGYAGSMVATLAALGGLAWWLWRGLRSQAVEPAPAPAPVQSLGDLWRRVFGPGRWPYWVGGLAVGWLSTLVLLRLRPLGVTAALGGSARQIGDHFAWLPERLEGLDSLGGCATAIVGALWQTPNALLVVGLVGGAWAAALWSGQFKPAWPRPVQVLRGLGGGLLLGWGAMVGLGCTVGNLLSGTMAGAVSGWVFGAAVFVAVWAGLRLGLAAPRT
jgi:uncharacterized membrane protein YedE/YeeE